ncbi:ABC transporter ATP-binding protein [Liberiplasma polymorphum]|uniref:ABC transporter ATP-binding protein n=1 Tax=Liberiplasma polymorphum TaxID=3374570 RepID=UPI00377229EA
MKSSTFKRIMQCMKGAYASYIIGIIGLSISALLFQTVIAFLFLNLFDTLTTGTFDEVLSSILPFIVYMLIVVAIMPLFLYLSQSAAVKTSGNLRKKVFTKLTALPLSYFKAHHSAETISIVTNDIAETEKAYSEHLINFLARVIMGIGTLVIMFIIEWRLALIPVFAGILTILVNSVYAKRLREVSKEVQENLAVVNTKLSNLLAGVHVIRIFNIQKLILDKFFKSNDDTLNVSNKRINKLATINSLNDLVFTIGFAGIVLVGALLVLEGLTTIGVIVAIVQLQNGVSELVRYLGNFITNLQASLAAGERVFSVIDEIDEPIGYPNVSIIDENNTAISLNEVTFSYDNTQHVLKDLTLAVKKNQSVALVGPSGGGKSTVFKLLLQFYPTNEGDIKVQGNTIQNRSLKALRSQMAYVPQDAYLFNASIKDNIAYGKEHATDHEIIEAAKSAFAHEFIMQLEDGYNTIVGEQGAKLSGGQRQRIAIARAIIKGAPILLLDEATSALDNESELLVQNALEKLMKDKTSIVIAHRLSTIEHADKIFVISEGKVVEEGSHEDLIKHPEGIYTSLHLRQLKLTD